MSIRLRLTLWYSNILAITLLIFGVGLYFFLDIYIYQGIKKELSAQTESVSRRIDANVQLTLKGLNVKLQLYNRDRYSSMLFQVYNFTNGTASRSAQLTEADLLLPIPQIPDAFIKKPEQQEMGFFEEVPFYNDVLLIYNIPIPIQDSAGNTKVVGLLQGAESIGLYKHFFQLLTYVLTFLAIVSVLLAATFGWLLSRKALKPIEDIIESAEQIGKSSDLGKRIDYYGPPDEVGRLTETINSMLARIQIVYSELEEAYAAQRRFVSDASHELRTPLTTIRGNVDLLEKMWRQTLGQSQRTIEQGQESTGNGSNSTQISMPASEQLEMSLEAMQDIAGEAKRMSQLVNDLLALARADAGFRMELKPIELKSLVEEVARKVQFLPRNAEWQVGDLQALDQAKYVLGNDNYLQQMLMIFIENAFKYTPSGIVELDALQGDGQIGIRISDTGIGMDKSEVPNIFDRFYRADISRGVTGGIGLGLSIAKWIIDEHDGSVEVITRKDEGSKFIIWLPYMDNNQHTITDI